MMDRFANSAPPLHFNAWDDAGLARGEKAQAETKAVITGVSGEPLWAARSLMKKRLS